MNIKLIFSLILAVFTVLFIIQNVAVVEIRFLYWTLSLSHSLLLFFVCNWYFHRLVVARFFHAPTTKKERYIAWCFMK